MDGDRLRMQDFRAGCAPQGGRGLRRRQTASAPPGHSEHPMCQASGDGPHAFPSASSKPARTGRTQTASAPPGQPERQMGQASGDGPHTFPPSASAKPAGKGRRQTASAPPSLRERQMCQASGDGPHAFSSASSKPTANAVVRALAPPPKERPNTSVPAKKGQATDPRIVIRQKILNNSLGSINQSIKLHWIQAQGQLKAEISDMYRDFVQDFSDRTKTTTTKSERKRLRLKMARAREDLFSAMKTRIRASCVDFGLWRSCYLDTQLDASSAALEDDGNFDALVAVLENQVLRSRTNFRKRTHECARAVWEEFVKDLGLETEFIPT